MKKLMKFFGEKIAAHVVLIFFSLTALVPLSLVLINSFKQQSEIVKNPLSLPKSLDFSNFTGAWTAGHFSHGFVNSILLTTTCIVIVLIASSCIGYVLAGKKVKIWPMIMVYFMVAMTVPIQLFLFPLYFIVAKLNLIGNVFAVGVILAAYYLPISVFLMRTYFLNVPYELEEAARIDGANTLDVLRHIMLPIVSPGLITVSVITGLMSWNEYLITSTFLQGAQNYTATLGFLSLNGTYTTNEGIMMAGAVILVLPVVVFFILIQNYFIDGLVSGAVKG
jgi:raffinose/stachyose/melibiose transport system permease protein